MHQAQFNARLLYKTDPSSVCLKTSWSGRESGRCHRTCGYRFSKSVSLLRLERTMCDRTARRKSCRAARILVPMHIARHSFLTQSPASMRLTTEVSGRRDFCGTVDHRLLIRLAETAKHRLFCLSCVGQVTNLITRRTLTFITFRCNTYTSLWNPVMPLVPTQRPGMRTSLLLEESETFHPISSLQAIHGSGFRQPL
jgi:hypothetical protein